MISSPSLKKTLRKLFVLLLIPIFFGIALNGYAADSTEPLDGTVTEPVTSAENSVLKEFAYNPVGKRDPFEPLVNQVRFVSGKSEEEKGPLEKFELGQFRLLAVLLFKGTPRAMVKAPDGKSYIVKPGDKIGKLEGEIVRIETKIVDPETRAVISPDRIVIKEKGYDPYSNKEVIEYRYVTM